MNQVKKDQFTAVAMLALLLLLTSVMVVNLDKFSSPAATSFGEVIGIAKNPSNAKGLLVVNVETNLTLLPKSSGSVEVGNQGLLDEPVLQCLGGLLDHRHGFPCLPHIKCWDKGPKWAAISGDLQKTSNPP